MKQCELHLGMARIAHPVVIHLWQIDLCACFESKFNLIYFFLFLDAGSESISEISGL